MAYERKEFVGNAAQTQLAAGITAAATTITVDDATNWPDGSTGPFIVAISLGEATEEKILCTGRVGTTLTVRASTGRGHDGTTAQAHSINATIDHVLDAETIDQVNRLANLMTTKGDIYASNGTNPVRVGTGATDASLDGYVLQLDWSEATGIKFARLVTVLSQASAPAAAGYVRLWHDTTHNLLRPSNGSSWPAMTVLPTVANASARDSLYATPASGDAVWRTDLGFAEVYNGTSWIPLGTPLFASTAARDSYFTSPFDGAEAYITGTSEKYLYRSSEWILTSHKHTVDASAPSVKQNGDLWLQPV